MKLKYYLRGLAVGILLTTIILTIANIGNKPLSDAQIRQRALALGMVDSESMKLSDLQNETESSKAESTVPESTAQESTVQESTVPESSETKSDVPTSTVPESVVPESKPAASSVESSVPESSSVSVSEPETTKPVTIQIKSGANSYTVSKDLAAAGLVEDAKAYDDYLCKNGYAQKIHVGTYEIVPGMSYEEIAKMIAH